VLLDRLDLTTEDLRLATGWEIKPEGACRGESCVPLADVDVRADGTIDVRLFAQRMDMPLVRDETHGLWALGPRAGGRVLDDVVLPEIALPDFDGQTFEVSALRGRKVVLLAWASW
jgi:hypothetical protein